MIVAVDTSVLLDVLTDDAEFAQASTHAIIECSRSSSLIIPPIVYSELAAAFPTKEALGAFLADFSITVEPFSRSALWRAGESWRSYARNRPKHLICPECGDQVEPSCPSCGRILSLRQHIAADFLIGAFAQEQADALLSRDRGFYRRWFQELRMIAPGETG